MKRTARQLFVITSFVALCASLLLLTSLVASAQSNDLGSPTPIYSPEITGRIVPLDVGDARQTRHFYTFNARPGDLELTVEASNLDGEIDLYAASTMRPLAQVALYSGLGSNIARTVFFRQEGTVVLRVQARTPNDSDGTYRIRLGGTFSPSTLPPPNESASSNANAPAPRATPAEKGVRRVNSIGARIEEPKSEATESAATTTTTPERATTPQPATTAKTPTTRANASNRTTTARRGTTRRGTTTRTNTPTADSAKASTGPAQPTSESKTAPNNDEKPGEELPQSGPARTTPNAKPARTNRASRAGQPASNATNTTPAASPAAATATGLEAPGARVVVEMRDGTRVEREMSDVRRVAVEGRFVVIVLKNGRVERHPLADVQRMSIEP